MARKTKEAKAQAATSYETVPLGAVQRDPRNARRHDRRNLDAIKASLARFGQQRPILVDAQGVLIAGEGTLTAAAELGWPTIEVKRSALSGAEARAYALADNRTTDLSTWDEDELRRTAEELEEAGAELMAAAGFIEDELDDLMAEMEGVEDDAEQESGRAGEQESDGGGSDVKPPTSAGGNRAQRGQPVAYQVLVGCADKSRQEAVTRLIRRKFPDTHVKLMTMY